MFSTHAIRSRNQTDFAGGSGHLAGEFAPSEQNLRDAQAVKSLRALVRTPQVHQALERGNDTALCFVLRAVNRMLSDEDQPNTTINRLWDVLENRALRQNSRMTLWQKKPPAR
jgi:hypothetical protein